MTISGFLKGAGQFLYDINKQTEQRQDKQDENFKTGVKVICDQVRNVSLLDALHIGPFKVSLTKSKDAHRAEPSAIPPKLDPSRVGGLISQASQASPASPASSAASSASASSIDSDDLTSLSDLGATSSASASLSALAPSSDLVADLSASTSSSASTASSASARSFVITLVRSLLGQQGSTPKIGAVRKRGGEPSR
jgi:hypothetical protein